VRRLFAQVEYAYSGVRNLRHRTIEGMLWSDPENEPPKELRDMQEMLRRLGLLMALAMLLAMIVLGVM
jgi:argininosuccinate synthase